jgi:hypothetical protein
MTDQRAGALLSALGTLYFARNNAYNRFLARVMGVHQQRQLSGAVVSTALSIRYMAGFPVNTDLAGLSIDVDQDLQSVVANRVGSDAVSNYLRGSGFYASASEGLIFEKTLGGTASSTVKVLQTAAAQRVPIYTVEQGNVDRVLPRLEIDSASKREISDAVARGQTVTVPERNVTIGGWTGTGYIVSDETTGAAAYRISAGLNGGSLEFLKEAGKAILEVFKDGYRATAQLIDGFSADWLYGEIDKVVGEEFRKFMLGCIAGAATVVLFLLAVAPTIWLGLLALAACLIAGAANRYDVASPIRTR